MVIVGWVGSQTRVSRYCAIAGADTNGVTGHRPVGPRFPRLVQSAGRPRGSARDSLPARTKAVHHPLGRLEAATFVEPLGSFVARHD